MSERGILHALSLHSMSRKCSMRSCTCNDLRDHNRATWSRWTDTVVTLTHGAPRPPAIAPNPGQDSSDREHDADYLVIPANSSRSIRVWHSVCGRDGVAVVVWSWRDRPTPHALTTSSPLKTSRTLSPMRLHHRITGQVFSGEHIRTRVCAFLLTPSEGQPRHGCSCPDGRACMRVVKSWQRG